MKILDRQVYPANKNIEIFYRINPSTNYFTIVLDLSAKLKGRELSGILGRSLLIYISFHQNTQK